MAKPAREPYSADLAVAAVLPRLKQPRAAAKTVTATALAKHLDLSQQRITQLADEHVIERLPDRRFDQDACRVAYLRWLRDPERRTARSKADQEFTQAKAELIRIRIAEKKRDLILYSEAEETGDKMIGIVLTKLSGLSARVGGDQIQRRKTEQVVFEVRTEMAEAFAEMANKVAADEQSKQASTMDSTNDD